MSDLDVIVYQHLDGTLSLGNRFPQQRCTHGGRITRY
jgi:hypothetical protein